MGLTSPGSVMGTPATMSPEQYDEPDSVDFLTDIYGLGCVLYEMLVGKPAFRARKLSEILAQKRSPQAPDPCQENLTVPLAVGALVQSMLAVSREDRPASYRELDERLGELITAIGGATRSMTKTQQKPVVGEETEQGAGPVLRPSKASHTKPPPVQSMDATIASKPTGGTRPPTSKPPAKPFTPKSDASGPGLLRTSELNFLAEGLENGAAANAAPAFQETPGFEATPAVQPAKSTTSAGQMSGVGAMSTAQPKSKAGLVIAAVALAGVGIGAYVVFGGGGKPSDPNQTNPPNTGGSNSGNPVDPKPTGANLAPVIASIDGETEHGLKKEFTLEAKASDADGDAGKLTYTWSVPDEVKLMQGRNQAKAKFRIEDGLPGVEFEIGVEVSDGKDTVKSTRKVVTGQVPGDAPLVGFEGKSEFNIDARDARWVDARLGYVACRASKALRTMQTTLGSDSYWEWSGTLVSETDEGTPPAKIGLRFEFGNRAWMVVCTRASDDDDAAWSIEMLEAKLDGTWKLGPVADSKLHQWPQTDPNVADTRGYFCVQRRNDKLVIEIGDASVPRNQQGAATEEERPTSRSKVTVTIPEFAGEPQLTLFVEQGRGEFRVRRR